MVGFRSVDVGRSYKQEPTSAVISVIKSMRVFSRQVAYRRGYFAFVLIIPYTPCTSRKLGVLQNDNYRV